MEPDTCEVVLWAERAEQLRALSGRRGGLTGRHGGMMGAH